MRVNSALANAPRLCPVYSHGSRLCIWCWVTMVTPEVNYLHPHKPPLSHTPGVQCDADIWSQIPHCCSGEMFPRPRNCQPSITRGSKNNGSSVSGEWWEKSQNVACTTCILIVSNPIFQKICSYGFTGCDWGEKMSFNYYTLCCSLRVCMSFWFSFKPQFE